MKASVQFQVKEPQRQRPYDESDFSFQVDDAGSLCLPGVGDSVAYTQDGTETVVARKVLTRHFSYVDMEAPKEPFLCINIVVQDLSSEEMAARLKE